MPSNPSRIPDLFALCTSQLTAYAPAYQTLQTMERSMQTYMSQLSASKNLFSEDRRIADGLAEITRLLERLSYSEGRGGVDE
ncbi:hypothetical protein PtrSN002B_011497, partial [Pyrenophora tritici-repentis]